MGLFLSFLGPANDTVAQQTAVSGWSTRTSRFCLSVRKSACNRRRTVLICEWKGCRLTDLKFQGKSMIG